MANKFGKKIAWEWREETRILMNEDEDGTREWNIRYVPCVVNEEGEVVAAFQFEVVKVVRKDKQTVFRRMYKNNRYDIWHGEWTPPADKPDAMPPCPAADVLVAAYNGNTVRDEALAELREKCGKLANSFEDWEHRDYANALRNIVKEADAKIAAEATPTEAALDALVEAATGLD